MALGNLGGGLPKVVHALSSLPRGARRLEKLCEDIHTSPEVIEAHTLNFKPNFKFLRLKFFWGGPPSQLGCALGSLGQSLARIKISGCSIP